MLKHDTLRKLSFIRYLYSSGEQQASGSLPYSAMLVLTFYDCIEWFLITTCEHLGINAPRSSGVYTYFDQITQSDKVALTGKMTLNKISSARDEFKHRLTIPSTISIQEIRYSAKNFLEENTFAIYKLSFFELSLLDFISNDGIREKLAAASEQIAASQYREAVSKMSEAFDDLRSAFRLNLMPY